MVIMVELVKMFLLIVQATSPHMVSMHMDCLHNHSVAVVAMAASPSQVQFHFKVVASVLRLVAAVMAVVMVTMSASLVAARRSSHWDNMLMDSPHKALAAAVVMVA